MNRIVFLVLTSVLLTGCGADAPPPAATPTPASKPVATPPTVAPPSTTTAPAVAAAPAPSNTPLSLKDARAGFRSRLVRRSSTREPLVFPPSKVFRTVMYEAPVGKLAAFVTPDPKDGKKHPAIVWITGGDSNTLGDVWSPASARNDQTAAQYREAGIVMMFPSLRGGNENPGEKEGFLGEVDDVLAAADYLSRLDYVDPDRLYLGGHSTGGTLALLVAESSDRFRAVFSFGPVDDIAGYGDDYLPFDRNEPRELELRSPGRWLASVTSPTFVIEGTDRGNVDALYTMRHASANPHLRFIPVDGVDHFGVLAPLNRLIARKILDDAGPASNLAFPDSVIRSAVASGE